MLILLMILTIILIILTLFTEIEELNVILIPVFLVELVALIIFANLLIKCRVIDEKIELYNLQNKEIEEKIEVVVKEYMDFENKTFTELKNEDSYITLVSLYPDLKSDELIKSQIELYTNNNERITSLKEQKLNKSIYKWWIYFGK